MSLTDTADFYSEISLQVCHCGWSKITTYQGLRIHQGKMGCTPKGMKIPKREQYDGKHQWEVEEEQKKHQPTKRMIKKEVYNNVRLLHVGVTGLANLRGIFRSTSQCSVRKVVFFFRYTSRLIPEAAMLFSPLHSCLKYLNNCSLGCPEV